MEETGGGCTAEGFSSSSFSIAECSEKRNKGEGENPQSKQFSAALGTPEE